MRHRKKRIVAALLILAGGYATICFWPHSNPEAVRALAVLREMIEADEGGEAPDVVAGKEWDGTLIACDMVIVRINMTDATAGLLAEPGRVKDKVTIGRIKTKHEFLEMLGAQGFTTMPNKPQFVTVPGGSASVMFGTQVPVIVPKLAGAAAPMVSYGSAGVKVTVTQNVTATGSFVLEVDSELAQAGKIRTIATPQGPDIHAISAKTRSELKPGETLVLGGRSHKRPDKNIFKLPVLGDLPGVGSRFHFMREREIEEELVVLVTPRILSANATPAVPVSSAPGR